MTKILFLVMMVLGAGSAQAADEMDGMDYHLSKPAHTIHHEQSQWSFGVGLTELVSIPFEVTPVEGMYISGYAGKRTENNRRIGKNFFINYQLTPNFSVQTGYTGGDPGSWAETNASIRLYDYQTGLAHDVPVSIKHRETYSAWDITAVAETSGHDVRWYGKLKSTHSTTSTETQTAFACLPACSGYQGESSTMNKVTLNYGFGLKIKVLERSTGAGDIWLLAGAEQMPNNKITGVVNAQIPF